MVHPITLQFTVPHSLADDDAVPSPIRARARVGTRTYEVGVPATAEDTIADLLARANAGLAAKARSEITINDEVSRRAWDETDPSATPQTAGQIITARVARAVEAAMLAVDERRADSRLNPRGPAPSPRIR